MGQCQGQDWKHKEHSEKRPDTTEKESQRTTPKMGEMTESQSKMMDVSKVPRHNIPRLVLLCATWVTLAITMFFNAMGQVDATVLKSGMFQNTTSNVNSGYNNEITPASWAFSIWGIIYIFQVIWLSYATWTVFKPYNNGYLLYNSDLLHPSLFVIYIINLSSNIIWMFVWDRRHTLVALFFLGILAFTLYLLIIISIYSLFKNQHALEQNGYPNEYKYVIGMVINAFGVYATWCTIATLLNFCNVVSYTYPVVTAEISSSISLGILAFEIMVYMVLDLGILERYLRFLWTPYFVLFWALGASLIRNFNPAKPNSIISLFLFMAVIAFATWKLILVIYREKKDPSFGDRKSGKVTPLPETKDLP